MHAVVVVVIVVIVVGGCGSVLNVDRSNSQTGQCHCQAQPNLVSRPRRFSWKRHCRGQVVVVVAVAVPATR